VGEALSGGERLLLGARESGAAVTWPAEGWCVTGGSAVCLDWRRKMPGWAWARGRSWADTRLRRRKSRWAASQMGWQGQMGQQE
jgi:hypothetical protein